jgi:hypothetical protein
MNQVNLLTKIYGPASKRVLDHIKDSLTTLSSGLRLKIKILGKSDRGFVQIILEGEDQEVALSYIRRYYGVAPYKIDQESIGEETTGKIVESGHVGYGLYLDLGLSSNGSIDALVPLRVLREQLVNGEPLSIRQLIKLFALQDNIPISIMITEVNSDKGEISAKLTDRQARTYRRWIRSNLERVIATGIIREDIKKALTKTDHSRDIIRIDSIGLLEHVIVCKEGTQAPGLIASLGPFLIGVPLYSFIPSKIKADIETITKKTIQ